MHSSEIVHICVVLLSATLVPVKFLDFMEGTLQLKLGNDE